MPISDEKWWMFCHGKSRIYARWNKEEEDDEAEEAALLRLWKSKGKPQFGGAHQLPMQQATHMKSTLEMLPGPPEMQELPECSQSSRCSGSTDSYGLAGAAGGAEQQQKKQWCRDRSRSRQKKHGLSTPEQLRECSSRPLLVL
jgi:hypothetical protein